MSPGRDPSKPRTLSEEMCKDESDVLSGAQSCLTLVAPWAIAHQAPLSRRFSRQENWSGLPFPSLGDLPNPGTELKSLLSPALAEGFFTTEGVAIKSFD